MRSQLKLQLQGMALVLLIACAFLPACFNRFIWDDDPHIADNANLRNLPGLLAIWTQPLSLPQFYPVDHTALWFAYHLWGLAPQGFHAMNIALHAISALLLWQLLRRLKIPYAWFAAALFAIHPVQVETVAWAMESKSILSGLFYFWALLILLPCWNLTTETPLPSQKSRTRYLLGTFVFLLSLLSKSVTATLPAVILLTIWWKRGRLTRRDILPTIPLFLIAAFSASLTALLERTHVGADGPEWQIPLLTRTLIAARAVCTYAQHLLWPHRLAFFYERWNIHPTNITAYFFPLAILATLAALFLLRTRIGRGDLAVALFFIGTLAPALGFVNVYPMRFSFIADHFQYLACIGIFLAAAGLLATLHHFAKLRCIIPALSAAILLTLATLTFNRCRVFHDNYTLFADNVLAAPDSWAAHTFFAASCFQHNDPAAGLENAARGAQLNPNDIDAREALAAALGEFNDNHSRELLALPKILPQNDPEFLNILAAAYTLAGDPAGAARLATRSQKPASAPTSRSMQHETP